MTRQTTAMTLALAALMQVATGATLQQAGAVIPGMGHSLPAALVPMAADAIVSAAERARQARRAPSLR